LFGAIRWPGDVGGKAAAARIIRRPFSTARHGDFKRSDYRESIANNPKNYLAKTGRYFQLMN
jgi:hypothetical protein